ncbi:MAG: response regulator [Clostridiales bacterium]|nr:response regulator [Clostridiales bacterium]
MSNPNDLKEQAELFHSSHLMILVTYTVFAAALIGESFLMGWEKWVLILVSVAVIVCWLLHFRQEASPVVRVRIYAVLMMCTTFFFGIHPSSTYDLGLLIAVQIILFTMTGMKGLITLAQFTYYITMAYQFGVMITNGEKFDALMLSRSALHLILIFLGGWYAKIVIDKWTQVLTSTQDEITQLTEDTERLNDFLANVSHEIRTPVNAVIGLTGICIDKSQNREILGDLISVRDAGRRVAEQISDILDYSELDRKKAVTNNEDYMLSSVLHDLVSELRHEKSKDVELIIDVDPAIPAVMNSDVSKLKKILRALISNGLKYTRKGGVYVRIVAEKQKYGVNLCIEVTDTGIGMSELELEKVYDSFYQADSGRARMGGGLGLGLAIVSGFVSLLGGFMTIQSKKDIGTTVNVSLPQKVVDPTGCMSVAHPDQLILGAYLHFEKYSDPAVRDYYNSMVLNIVKGLGVQMHRVNNSDDLRLLHDSIHMTHLFVAEEEYEANVELIEELAKEILVVVVANDDFVLPQGSASRIMEKPFYCFPVVSVLNTSVHEKQSVGRKMFCRGVKALIVDDEPMNLVVGKSIFRSYGMEVTTVLSGQESIDICREKVFDIIFMDHMMSGMDGVEAMKRIRSDVSGKNGEIPIVALTANAMSSAKQMFLSEGFDGFVSKPIEIEELERVMRQVLPKSMVSMEEIREEDTVPVDFESMRSKPDIKVVNAASIKEYLKGYDIDTKIGMKYCMDDFQFYKDLLIQFALEADEKSPLITRYYESGDWHNYEILVHALKSTAKMIGAEKLSEDAKALEMAAKENREEYIAENHYSAMSEYATVVKGISEFLEEDIKKAKEEKGVGDTSGSEADSTGSTGASAFGKVKEEDGAIEFEPVGSDDGAPPAEEEILEFIPEEDEEGGEEK